MSVNRVQITDIDSLCRDIDSRSRMFPHAVAIRLGGESVTTAVLADALRTYTAVTDRFAMSRDAALAAAILHAHPTIARMSPALQARTIRSIIANLWLEPHRRRAGSHFAFIVRFPHFAAVPQESLRSA